MPDAREAPRPAPARDAGSNAGSARHPLLFEINTRCWLNQLSGRPDARLKFNDVPEAEFARWQRLGVTHVWLMGVWTTGPRSRACALADEFRPTYRQALPDFRDGDVWGSPYAVGDYRVPEILGGETGLEKFRSGLHDHGLKLILDFVPNHLGLDHRWTTERPELFVQGAAKSPGTFRQTTRAGVRWLAHGRDPYFPPWTDTAQLDYRQAATRAVMTEALLSVAARCDGVRCDMAMLLLNDVFARTWTQFPPADAPAETGGAPGEFWQQAVAAVKRAHPDFVFLAEVYWGLEERLRALGFDYTYDKELYDQIVRRYPADAQQHLLGLQPAAVCAGAHFLENHDEPRVASILSAAEQWPAALLILALPGMRFLHDGQLDGARARVPVQLARRAAEPRDANVAATYERILATLPRTAVGRGKPLLLGPRAAWPGNPTAQNFVLVQWQDKATEFDLAVVNLAPHRSQCYAPLEIESLAARDWSMTDLLGTERYRRAGGDLRERGLYLDLPGHGAQLFHFQPAA